jgi:putative transposase
VALHIGAWYFTFMVIDRKRIRLASGDYLGKRTYFVTICTHRRMRVFDDVRLGQWLVRRLRTISGRMNFLVHAYCVMPDHLHLLAAGAREDCDLIGFVSILKQRTGFAFTKRFGKELWQFKFYDHIVRSSERAEAVAWYIWGNPLRKGLCDAPQLYPLSGSFTRDWLSRCAPVESWKPSWKRM